MTTDWKNKLKDWFEGSNLVLTILLAVSIIANGYLLYERKITAGNWHNKISVLLPLKT